MGHLETAVVIGTGHVGTELLCRLAGRPTHVAATLTSKHHMVGGEYREGPVPNFGRLLDELNRAGRCPDTVFITMANRDEGQAELDLILAAVKRSIYVVDCAKRAGANFWPQLSAYSKYFFSTAAVGGGTGIIPWLQKFDLSEGHARVHVILNGTTNYVLWAVSQGATYAEAWAEAVRLHYAEPDAGEGFGGFRGECGDPPIKSAHLFNRVFAKAGESLTAAEVNWPALSDRQMATLMKHAATHRLVITFSRPVPLRCYTIGPALCAQVGDWHITGGFREIRGTLAPLLLPGVGNGVVLEQPGAKPEILTGLGAGPESTVDALLADFDRILHH